MNSNKKLLTETEIRSRYITPAIRNVAGWDWVQIGEEITLGKIIVRGKAVARGSRKRVDYLLSYEKNIHLAIVEAKDNTQEMGAGMQQALEYARLLDVPFVYSSNGDGFVEHDRTRQEGPVERVLGLHEFPSPDELWERYKAWKGLTPEAEKIVREPYYPLDTKKPRYYQQVAINRTVEAVAKGQKRILLVMATGTGKTYTAFHIMWRLWKAKKVKRILFLADRNILVDQARTNDFKPFGGVMTKVTNRQVDKSFEIYLALYQAVSGTEEKDDIYKQFSPEFFDLIFVDECHRGSAAENSAWREILEYFAGAVQVGLTATPKETTEISNIDYFGDPVYTYSLKQGIEDGFLAPYKVIRIELDKDMDGWRPRAGQRDVQGLAIPDQVYYGTDFDKTLVIEERTQLVAWLISEHLRDTDRMQKVIVFCRDIAHAEEMRRALINENGDLFTANNKYIMRITGDSKEGKNELDNFIDPAEPYPVIVTTSKLLNTGVDTQTVKLIVLDAIINSMTEFKQIIGRGTRVREKEHKLYFTIMDFRNATRLFQDPDFDGDPVKIIERKPEGDETGNEDAPETGEEGEGATGGGGTLKYKVRGVEVKVLSEMVQYYGKDGKLVTESITDYTRQNLLNQYPTLDAFLKEWFAAERKQAIVEALLEQGIFLARLEEEVGLNVDPFDLVCHLAFDKKWMTRTERARNVKQRPGHFEKYGEIARNVMETLLDRYAEGGVAFLDMAMDGRELFGLFKIPQFAQFGSPLEIVKQFGGREGFFEAVKLLEAEIYREIE